MVEKVVCRSPRREGGYQSKWNTIWGAVPRGVGLAGIAAADKLPPNPEVHIRRGSQSTRHAHRVAVVLLLEGTLATRMNAAGANLVMALTPFIPGVATAIEVEAVSPCRDAHLAA